MDFEIIDNGKPDAWIVIQQTAGFICTSMSYTLSLIKYVCNVMIKNRNKTHVFVNTRIVLVKVRYLQMQRTYLGSSDFRSEVIATT